MNNNKKQKVIAFLPAKGSSERIPAKNLKFLAGKPLFLHTLEKLCSCDFIDEVYLDSESEEIFKAASEYAEYDFIKLKRNTSLANNSCDGNKLFLNELKEIKSAEAELESICIQILCTSPFIKPETIRHGIQILQSESGYDSVVLVKKEKLYTWDESDNRPNYDLQNIPNSFTLENTVIETMGLYITKAKTALEIGRRIGNKPFFLEAEPIEAIDINNEKDFELAELLMRGAIAEEVNSFQTMKMFLSSALISDVFDELEIKNRIISGMSLNFPDKKIFGRAKTIKIIPSKEPDDLINIDAKNIYKALESYKTLNQGDIIVVENNAESHAYFGFLNASLAIRSGAKGAVIGSFTRDCAQIKNLGFPVFAQGYSSKDLKNKACIESINKKIKINGVEIFPEDLIFGDFEGIAVIPKKFEKSVLEKCLLLFKKEHAVFNSVLKGNEIELIREEFGDF